MNNEQTQFVVTFEHVNPEVKQAFTFLAKALGVSVNISPVGPVQEGQPKSEAPTAEIEPK